MHFYALEQDHDARVGFVKKFFLILLIYQFTDYEFSWFTRYLFGNRAFWTTENLFRILHGDKPGLNFFFLFCEV